VLSESSCINDRLQAGAFTPKDRHPRPELGSIPGHSLTNEDGEAKAEIEINLNDHHSDG
jgi:hypothetical protein